MQYKKSIALIILIILIDQVSKILVKTNMDMNQEINVIGEWFKLHYTENFGMAFGLEFFGRPGKVILSLFRLIAAGLISYYIFYLIKRNTPSGYIYSLCLILAGAIGNIIDSIFYGVIFSYDGLLFGRVVDMLYFPLWRGYLPEWIPFIGGDYFIFFRPVFNIADSAITIGVATILIFYRKMLREI